MEEDYKKKYEEMVQRAKELHEAGNELTKRQMEIVCPVLAESEDEKIRKWLYNMVENLGYPADEAAEKELEEMQPLALAYLEKQKKSLHIEKTCKDNGDTFTDEDERIRKGMIRFLESEQAEGIFTHEARLSWISYLERQKEQKPTEYLSKQKVYDIMNKLTELSTSDLIPIESEEYVRIHEITSDVCSLLDYPIKPVEWNEYDKACISNIVLLLDGNGKYVPDGARQQCLEWFNEHKIAFQNRSVEWSKEDEKIRKEIRDLLVNACEADRRYPKLLAWLEPPRQEQNPEWSEFDKGALNDAICATDMLGNDESFNKDNPNLAKAFRIAKDWLETLPERFSLQPKQEWSEEDKVTLNNMIRVLDKYIEISGDTRREFSNWLKSLQKRFSYQKIIQ